jgi:hypothetical protein
LISSGRDGKSEVGGGRLSIKERMSSSIEVGNHRSMPLPLFAFESLNSKVEGTVEGASSCNSKLEVINELHTSASNAPSE